MDKHIDKFKHVLHDDENIVFSTTVNLRTYIATKLFSLFAFLPLILILTVVSIVISNGLPILIGIVIIIPLMILMISVFLRGARNYCICLTNKRIIVRRRIFTTKFSYYSIEKVTGNVETHCSQSFLDRKNEKICGIIAAIELYPVGHGKISILTPSLIEGQEFAKRMEKQVKENAKKLDVNVSKE